MMRFKILISRFSETIKVASVQYNVVHHNRLLAKKPLTQAS